LTQAVDAAWQRAVAAAEADGSWQRAEARRAVAGSLLAGAPALELSHRDGRWGPGDARESEVVTSLPLALPSARNARQAAGNADVAQAEAQRRHARWQVAGQVREAVWSIETARVDETQAQAHAATLEQLATDVERRVHAGDLARADHLAARSEALAAQASSREAALKLGDAQRQWTVLTGLPAPTSASTVERGDGAAPESHPALEWANRLLEQARRNADLVAATRRDAPELRVGLRQEADGFGTSRTSAGIGVRIPFGAEVRNRPRETEAWTAVDLAQRQLDSARLRVEADQAQAKAALEAAQARVQAEEARDGLTRERSQLVRKAFDAGDMGLPELLRALSAASTAQADLTRADAALGLARARVAHAQGITP
jgi:cobalt-zinc-cadmium efflux system outer membrane protein